MAYINHENYFGRNIRVLCTYYGISQNELSNKIGFTKSATSKVINHGASSRINTAIAVADVFQVDLETLVRVDLSQLPRGRLHELLKDNI